MTPYFKQSLRGHPEKDDFNFYQSRCRINVECAFGILVQRLGVLRRPLRNKLSLINEIVSVCIKLHNICIADNTKLSYPMRVDISKRDLMDPIGFSFRERIVCNSISYHITRSTSSSCININNTCNRLDIQKSKASTSPGN